MLIIVFVMFIALLIGVRAGTHRYKESQIIAAQESMEILADTQRAQFDRYISDKISLLQGWTTFPEIYEMDMDQQKAFIKGHSNALGFHQIFVIREDGIGIYFEESTTRNQKDEPFYANVMENEIYITEPFYGADATTMTISASIYDEDGNKVGALCGAIDLNEIQQMFNENRMFLDGISYLINRYGTYIAATDMEKVRDKGIIYEEEDADISLIREAFENREDTAGVMVQDGEVYLTNITYLKDYDWVIVQGISREKVFQGLRYIDYWSYVALAIVVVIILCVIRIILHWTRNSRKINTDTLTGCGSRAAMQNLIDHLEHIYKYDITIIYLDLNRFKQVNDTYGHESGDKILCIFAESLMEVFGGQGQVGRMGGDEFMVVLLDVPQYEIFLLYQRLEERLAEQSRNADLSFVISTSYGYATRVKGDTTPLEELVRQADQNMYWYKERQKKDIMAGQTW